MIEWLSMIWLNYICFVERGELHKDIEQLCMQQAGPGYLAAATRMHFQRYSYLCIFFSVYRIRVLSFYDSARLLLVKRDVRTVLLIIALLGQLDWSRRLRIWKSSWLLAQEIILIFKRSFLRLTESKWDKFCIHFPLCHFYWGLLS